jgi:soluble lytic murein transglycosylase-like protein
MAAVARPLRSIVRACVFVLLLAAVATGAGEARAAEKARQNPETAALLPGIGRLPQAVAVPKVLDEADRALYRELFALEENGRHAEADRLIGRLSDPLLTGDLLAARFLSPTYKTSYAELRSWLANYADLPDAERIHKLAMRKKPKGAEAPRLPLGGAKLRGARLPFVLECTGKGEAQALDQAREAFSVGNDQDAYARAERIAAASCPEAVWLAGLAAFRSGDNAAARRQFEALAEAPGIPAALTSAAAFWASRVHLRGGRPQLVSHWLGAAADHPRTFYGLLAQRALGVPMRLSFDTEPFTDADLAAVGDLPRVRHAVALLEVGQRTRAETLLRVTAARATPPVRRAVVTLAEAAGIVGLPARFERTSGRRGAWRDEAAAYPVPDWQPVNRRPIDRALVYSLVKNESGFQARARNATGASGVMQLMPTTARFAAKRAGIRSVDHKALGDPEINIALGQSYLEYLAATPEVDGDLFRLIAAYNAGPKAVGRWKIARGKGGDPLMFIESLPSRETREFVEQVVADYWIYKLRFGHQTPSLDAVAGNRWPRYEMEREQVGAAHGKD